MAQKILKQKWQKVRTTVLTIDWESIDWESVNQNCCIVRYDIPSYLKGAENFGRLHNWFKNQSDLPYYLHTYGPHLYVKYESQNDIKDVYYSEQKLPYAIVDIQNERDLFHAVFKTLVSDYFQTHENFVSNANFFLRASRADRDYVLVLKVRFNQDWRHNLMNDFIVTAEATRLRKLSAFEFNETQDWSKRIFYGRTYQTGTAYFRQIRASSINSALQNNEDIFVEYHNSGRRASIPFHSVKNARELQRSRSYLLNELISNLIVHFNRIGLPFMQKYFEMEQVGTKSGAQMKDKQLPQFGRTIHVVDARIGATLSNDSFVEEFCALASGLLQKDQVIFKSQNIENLSAGDWVLRIQDYDADHLASGSILDGHADSKTEFYGATPHLVKQTLNINPNSTEYEDDMKKPAKERRAWSKRQYLDYNMDLLQEHRDEYLQHLNVCLNQLFLKDIIQFPGGLLERFPMVEHLQGKVFMAYGVFVYFDGDTLRFIRVDNDDFERGAEILYNLTGKRLLEDILDPSRNLNYYEPEATKRFEDVKKRKFIIATDYVLEIVDSEIQILYEDQKIRERLLKQEIVLPKENFYPSFSTTNPPIFSETQLQKFEDFLDNQVQESYISYHDLKRRYGKEIKDRPDPTVLGTGFYRILGITNDSKLKQYYKHHLGLVFESPRDQSVIPVYQGIWYEPTLQLYLVGSKDGVSLNQERGFVFREIQCHNWQRESAELKTYLLQEVLPLLEVNFIRHNNYTVYPFPFKLIQIWSDLEAWKVA